MGANPWIVLGTFGFTVLCIMTVMHKLKYPSKSWMIALLNTLLTPLKILGVGPFSTGSLTLEKMMPLAITANGLSDFGDLTFVSIYRTVREYYDFKSQVYTPLGYIMAKSELEMVLNRRLQAIEYLKRNPEISSIPTPSPIFVFGLGRSGTTFLHRLLSLDPNHRSPKLWELCFSVPDQSLTKDSSQEAFQKDRSIRQMTMQHLIDQRNQMGDDGLDLYHEIGCDLPEECLFAMANEIPLIASYVFSTLVNWTQFRASLTSKDIVRSYAWYKSILQILSFQTGDRAKGNQWVLKCPVHSFFIPELLQVFPDAKLVWAHRHPKECVPSLCSLLYVTRALYYDHTDLDVDGYGNAVAQVFEKLVEQTPKDIQSCGRPVANVLFEKLTTDPIDTVRQLYKQFKLPFSSEYEKILKNYLQENYQQRELLRKKYPSQVMENDNQSPSKGLHKHQPEDWGLTAERLSQGAFAEYIKRYRL